MRNLKILALTSALVLSTTPAFAGEKDRARQSIAEAEGKISAAAQVQTGTEAPALTTEAQAALRDAREQLGRGHELRAIDAAHHASELADRAVASSKSAADTNAQAQVETQAAVGAAQADAAAANARADAAAQAAQAAAADAAAARAQPVIVQTPAPAPAATTVTTETQTSGSTVTSGSGTVSKPRVVKRTTRARTVRATPKVTTKTTVQTNQ